MTSVNAFATLLEAFFNIFGGHTHTHRHEGIALALLRMRAWVITSWKLPTSNFAILCVLCRYWLATIVWTYIGIGTGGSPGAHAPPPNQTTLPKLQHGGIFT